LKNPDGNLVGLMEENGDPAKHVHTLIYAAQSALDAEIVIALLRSNHLHPPDLARAPHVSIAGADLYYYVAIPATEAVLARILLKAHSFTQGLMQDESATGGKP
jgi:hypothetical protein